MFGGGTSNAVDIIGFDGSNVTIKSGTLPTTDSGLSLTTINVNGIGYAVFGGSRTNPSGVYIVTLITNDKGEKEVSIVG